MYFVDDLHEKNYDHLVNMVFRANNNPEYKVISYILALPEIYSRCINDPLFHEFPFLWRYIYTDTSHVEKDEDEEYLVIDFDVEKDEDGQPVLSDSYTIISSGYKKMIDLASNLFNSSNDNFNLMNSLGTWDDRLIKVYYQAVSIRMERKKKIDGLTVSIK